MITRLLTVLTTLAFVAACDEVAVTAPSPSPSGTPAPAVREVPDELGSRQQSLRTFGEVVRRMEPVAERECRARTRNVNCDFKIIVDDRPNAPSNAFQTLDDNGRPLLVFTERLIDDARNADELAFVLGHEAAHHVRGHIARQQQNAAAGAVIFGGLATTLTGGDAGAIESAQRIGAQVGARTYSKDFELEADALGTVITAAGGYDPVKGAQFFNRIPDPGDRFLGTHPPNAQRIEIVRRTAAGL